MKRRFLPVIVATLLLALPDWAEAIPRLHTYMAGASYSGPRWEGLGGTPGWKDGRLDDAMDALPAITVLGGTAGSYRLGGVELTNLAGPLHDAAGTRQPASYHVAYRGGSDHRLFGAAHVVGSSAHSAAARRLPEPGTLVLLIAGILILVPILSRKRTQEEAVGS